MIDHPEYTKLIHMEPESNVVFLLDVEHHLLSNVERI
jgi:hypothetical protein